MNTTIDEIADGIHRISTFAPEAGMTFNQFLVDADEPFLFHLGMRALFPSVSAAVEQIVPLDRLRWLGFGHVEADECGSLNQWLDAAPNAEVMFGALGCMVSVADLADRPPRPLDDGEVVDLGGRRVRYLATPHVPHGWESGVFFEETTATLLCGDLFTQLGDGPALSTESPLPATREAEQMLGYTAATSDTSATIERLADLEPTTLALMHGPSHRGPAGDWLRQLATDHRVPGA